MVQLIPANEAERLAAVRRYDILDTPPDGALDRVTRLAADMFRVPISIVSIVDHDRIWFKSHHGVEVEEIPRDPGLCASAILDGEPWILSDAKVDPRALANPLVAGDFGLRFYAGVPLRTHDGFNLGTLCVIDRKPRPFGQHEVARLADLAAIVMDELELRLSSRRALAEKEILFREVHHRVKNNLQVVSSLLAVQSRSLPREIRAHFEESLRRIHAMGLLHERFYKGHSVEAIDLSAYLGELLESMIDAFGLRGRVTPRVDGPPIRIELDIGTPLALLSAEVIANACKHAFPGERSGEIAIRTSESDGAIRVAIQDDGIGHPAPDQASSGMGQRLIASFVKQLQGSSRFEVNDGTTFELIFPYRHG